jgi:hypothetical protein
MMNDFYTHDYYRVHGVLFMVDFEYGYGVEMYVFSLVRLSNNMVLYCVKQVKLEAIFQYQEDSKV